MAWRTFEMSPRAQTLLKQLENAPVARLKGKHKQLLARLQLQRAEARRETILHRVFVKHLKQLETKNTRIPTILTSFTFVGFLQHLHVSRKVTVNVLSVNVCHAVSRLKGEKIDTWFFIDCPVAYLDILQQLHSIMCKLPLCFPSARSATSSLQIPLFGIPTLVYSAEIPRALAKGKVLYDAAFQATAKYVGRHFNLLSYPDIPRLLRCCVFLLVVLRSHCHARAPDIPPTYIMFEYVGVVEKKRNEKKFFFLNLGPLTRSPRHVAIADEDIRQDLNTFAANLAKYLFHWHAVGRQNNNTHGIRPIQWPMSHKGRIDEEVGELLSTLDDPTSARLVHFFHTLAAAAWSDCFVLASTMS